MWAPVHINPRPRRVAAYHRPWPLRESRPEPPARSHGRATLMAVDAHTCGWDAHGSLRSPQRVRFCASSWLPSGVGGNSFNGKLSTASD